MTAILFLKAAIPGGARGDLFDQPVQVQGYTRGGTYVAPHTATRKKAPEAPAAAAGKDWRDETNWHARTQGRMKTLTDDALRYVVKDASDAARASDSTGSAKAGQYQDEAHYAAMELRAREKKAARAQTPSRTPPEPQAAPPPGQTLPAHLSALADNNIYGRSAWEDAWERATEGERARMEHHAQGAAEAGRRGDRIRVRREQESLDMIRAGIMERAVYRAQAEAAAPRQADPAEVRARELKAEYEDRHMRFSDDARARSGFFSKLRAAARKTKDGTTAAAMLDIIATRAGMDEKMTPLQFMPGDAEPAAPAKAAPAGLGTYDRMKLRDLYREAVHGAGAPPRRAARAQIDAILTASGMSIRDAFEANNLDISAYFASQPIG